MSQDERDQRATPTVFRLLADGRLVELVYVSDAKRTMLAVNDGRRTDIVEEIEIGGGTRLVPIPGRNNLIRHGAILLPDAPAEYGDVGSLVNEIEGYMDRYVAVSERFRRLAAYYILLTWVYDAFQELPYLRLQADWGSGKTRALIVIGSLCCRPFFASGASTVSPIFHTLDTFRGTLILDEADFRFSDQTAELTKILNNGNVQGFPVFRTAITPQKEFDPRAFQVFGPKLIAMRKAFDDEALESRFITERLDRVRLRPGIPINLPQEQKEEARILRNKLLQYRFDWRLRVRPDATLVDPLLSPRTNQILVPLLSIVFDEAARRDIREALLASERESAATRSTSTEAGLLEIVAELSGSEAAIPVADVTARFAERYGADYERPVTNRYMGSLLRNRLGFQTYKSHGIYLVATDNDRVLSLSKRYGITRRPNDAADGRTGRHGDVGTSQRQGTDVPQRPF